MIRLLLPLLALALPATLPGTAAAELRGHGGPVRALALSPDGRLAMSGSFDQSAIIWDLQHDVALAVLRLHDGAVNAAVALPDGRFATGGEDGRIALWKPGSTEPQSVLAAHEGPIVALSVSPDGKRIASASWDGTARVTNLAGGEPRVLSGHQGQVNGVAWLPDGRIATVGYDGTLRLWNANRADATIITLGLPLNGVAAVPNGEIAVGGADGALRILDAHGEVRHRVDVGPTPIIALGVSPDGTKIAAGAIGGSVAVVERESGKIAFTLNGPGLPIWSLVFSPDGRQLFTGGADRIVRRWDMKTGEHIGAVVLTRPEDPRTVFAGDRGAEVFQACAACHTLTADGGNRAGPTLHGVFGRRIASAPGYNYSPALKNLDIVWGRDTIARLFEIGPSHYTPGTKMPEQTIGNPRDREALVRFLEKATR
jgi:cytochrome c